MVPHDHYNRSSILRLSLRVYCFVCYFQFTLSIVIILSYYSFEKAISYHDEKCEHVICQDCGKDLTQAYIEGIKDGTYKNVKITSDVSYSQNKSSSILKMYNLSYDSSMPLYEDYLNNGGWDRSCKNKNVTTKIVTVSVCSPGATWNKWIVDKKAYDEQVIVGYKCSCGEWKLVTN